MAREIIAEIRLAPGEVGYYDDYSRIYLSTAKPSAYIYSGMNTTQIRRSIRSGRLRLISGSLFGPAADKKKVKAAAPEPKKATPKQEEKAPEPEEVKVEEAPVEEVEPITSGYAKIVSEETVEEPETETTVATLEEAKPRRRRNRKKADAE